MLDMSEEFIVLDDLNASPEELFKLACNLRAELRKKLEPYVSMLESIDVSSDFKT